MCPISKPESLLHLKTLKANFSFLDLKMSHWLCLHNSGSYLIEVIKTLPV